MIVWEDVEDVAGSHLGKFDAACPICGPECKSPANRIRKVLRIWRDETDFATYSCARCGAKGWTTPDPQGTPTARPGVLARAFMAPAKETAEDLKERAWRSAFAEFTFCAAGEIGGTLAEQYLAKRGLTPGADLRFTALAPNSYKAERSSPAMIAAVRDAAGAIVGAQATYLLPDATKTHRTSFGRFGKGAVRLAQVGQDGVLGVAEGVETALAFTRLYGVPCWAALSAVGIEQFEPPPGLTRLVVAADHDSATGRGFNAAQKLAKRVSALCEVAISMPAAEGDWNDELLARKIAA